MNKFNLKKSLENAERDFELCSTFVDATFDLLSEMMASHKGVTLEGIGTLGMHERQGANKEIPNEKGIRVAKNQAIFFHPTSEIKEAVTNWVEDVSED